MQIEARWVCVTQSRAAERMVLSNRMMFCKHFFAYLNDLAAFSGYSVVYQS